MHVFIKAISIEFRLQFRHPQSVSRAIRWIFLVEKCNLYDKMHVFIKAISIEFRLQCRHPESVSRAIRWLFLV